MRRETHECPRCACRWSARNGAYHDELIEWMHHYDLTVVTYRERIAALHREITRLELESFLAQTRAFILYHEGLLLRYDITEALRKVPDTV